MTDPICWLSDPDLSALVNLSNAGFLKLQDRNRLYSVCKCPNTCKVCGHEHTQWLLSIFGVFKISNSFRCSFDIIHDSRWEDWRYSDMLGVKHDIEIKKDSRVLTGIKPLSYLWHLRELVITTNRINGLGFPMWYICCQLLPSHIEYFSGFFCASACLLWILCMLSPNGKLRKFGCLILLLLVRFAFFGEHNICCEYFMNDSDIFDILMS